MSKQGEANGAMRAIAYQPALDGLRALAVVLVLLFHGGVSWLGGGYVGVSVFFTLSGYLITTLLLVEHRDRGRIAAGAFYSRRAKRLLPASLVCLTGVMLLATFGTFDQFPHLRRDLWGSLFQVENWVKLAGDASYADLTNATVGRLAPLEHYWSLAIEEQFYWIWPIAMIVLLRLVRTGKARAIALSALAAAGIAAAPIVAAAWGPDAAYWSTPARIGEILVGAATAGWLHWRPASHRRWSWLAPVGLVVVLWAATTWPTATGPAYSGWLPVFALASAAMIVGLQQPSVVHRVLAVRPAVWIGGISYGLYLYHWPLFAVLDGERTGWSGGSLLAVRLAATVVIAVLSARWVERPIRAWSPTWSRPLLSAAVASALLAVGIGAWVDTAAATRPAVAGDGLQPVDGSLAPLRPANGDASTTSGPVAATEVAGTATANTATADTAFTDSTSTASAQGSTAPDRSSTTSQPSHDGSPRVPVPTTSRELRIVVIGDSTAEMTAVGIADWAIHHPGLIQIESAATPGCGFLREGKVPTDGDVRWDENCAQQLDDHLPAALAELRPDVVLLMVTLRDVQDRQFDGIADPISPFDERYATKLREAYEQMADRLLAAGIPHLAWVIAPPPIADFQGAQRVLRDRRRYEIQWGVIREVAALHPDEITVLDVDAWLRATGEEGSTEVRPDGLHWSDDAALWVSEDYLVGSLVQIALS